MPRKRSLAAYSIVFIFSLSALNAEPGTIVLDFGQIDQNSVIYPSSFPLYQSDMVIGNISISSCQGVPLGSYLRIKENINLARTDTVQTSIDYIQGDYLYRDLVVGYHAPIYSNDVVSMVSQNRKFSGYYGDLEDNLQNHSLQYLNRNDSGYFGVGFIYHNASYNLPVQNQTISIAQEDFFSGIDYKRSIGRLSIAMSYTDQYGEHYSSADGSSGVGVRKYSLSTGYDLGKITDRGAPASIFINYLSSTMVGPFADELDRYQLGVQGNLKRLKYMVALARYNKSSYLEYAFTFNASDNMKVSANRYIAYGPNKSGNIEINKFCITINQGNLELSIYPIIMTEVIAPIGMIAGVRLGYRSDYFGLNILSYIYSYNPVAFTKYNSLSFSYNPSIKGKRFKPFLDVVCSWYRLNGSYDSQDDYTGIYMQDLDSDIKISPHVSIGVETRQFRISYNIKNTSQAMQIADFYPRHQVRYMKVEWLFNN